MGRRRRKAKLSGGDNVGGSSRGNNDHQKDEVEQNSDQFSKLPDSLLVEILSFLPIDDAVRTGILCKRWKTLWTLFDRIGFFWLACGRQELERFISHVDHILMQCACPSLKEFSLHMLAKSYVNPEVPAAAIEKWLQYVSSKNVKFLNLEVSFCRFLISGPLSWSALEKLSLKYILMDDKEMGDILLKCPLLDTLILDNCKDINHLNIASPKLRKLKVLHFCCSYYADANTFLEINAPWLQELEISGVFTGFECRLADVSSLVFAKVTFGYSSHGYCGCSNDNEKKLALEMANKILKKLYHIEELIVGSLLIQALSVLKLSGKSSPLFKCKQLTIESALLNCDLPGIACLLQSSPHLETLIIQLVNPDQIEYFDETYNVNGEEYLSIVEGNFQHLKNVKVVDERYLCPLKCFGISESNKSYDFELVAYLLKNACALQKLVISPVRNNTYTCCERSRDYILELLSLLSHKLLWTCLCGNDKEAAQWAFTKKQFDYEFTFPGSSSCKWQQN